MRPITKTIAGALTLLLGAAVAQGKWMKVDEPVPAERLTANIQRFIEQHPQDAQGYYVLGRVQSLVYAGGGQTVNVITPGKPQSVQPGPEPRNAQDAAAQLPGFAAYQSIRVEADPKQKLDAGWAASAHL